MKKYLLLSLVLLTACSNPAIKYGQTVRMSEDEMNEFMKALAQCLIVWNGRQPKEFQV